MDVSLVVATRNRSSSLQRCLASVVEIKTRATWELIVVDNGSTDDTASALSTFAKSSPFPIKLLYESRPGLGRAHNKALSAAEGELLCFFDDDCYPEPRYIDEIVKVFRDSEIGFMGGRVRLFDRDDAPIAVRDTTETEIFLPRTYLGVGCVHGANMAFRKRVLEEIGGFDPSFGPGAHFNCEDIDACARASFAGWKGGYFPGPTVAHHHGRRSKDLTPLIKNYRFGQGAYFAKFIFYQRGSAGIYLYHWLSHLAHWVFRHPRRTFWDACGMISYLRYRLVQKAAAVRQQE